MNRWSALAVLLAIAGALALRAPRLDLRPLHNDEAVNGLKVCELWEHGRYAYDPDEYHGPTLHYATLPFLWLSGANDCDHLPDSALRLAPLAFGVGLILLLPLFANGLGRHAIVWAAFLTAASPAMVFYSRYFIHEMLLVFFTALALGAGWRYAKTRSAAWIVVAGACLGLMYATKETFVIPVAAMVLAGIATYATRRREPQLATQPLAAVQVRPPAIIGKHILWGVLAALSVWLLFFSSFFTHFSGLADSIRTYLPWLKRAGGQSPHIHSWSFYLERLAWFHPVKKGPAWSEGLILFLALAGIVVSLFGRKSPLHRFLAFYTVVLTAAYSLISYKTPWCLLGFLQPMILLAGVGAAAIIEWLRLLPLKAAAIVVLAGLTVQLAWQAWRASFKFPADRRNPYVYAQTLPNLLELVKRVEGIAAVAAGHDTIVKVVGRGGDYWPLPWYLRRFKHVGWYDHLPDDPYAPIVIVSSALDARLDEKSGKKWIMAGGFELRPREFLELYAELELWKKYVETLPRERE